MRKETVFSTINTAQLYRTRDLPGGSWVNTNGLSGTSKVKYVETVDTPNFMRLCKLGEFLPIQPFEVGTTIETKVPSGQCNWKKRKKSDNSLTKEGEGKFVSGVSYLSVPPADLSIIDGLVLEACSRAAESEFDVLTFMAEWASTVRTVESIGRRFNNITRNMALSAKRFRRNPWEKFRELWLEARYGVRPLVYDAYSAAQAFSSDWEDGDLVKGSASHTDSDSDSTYETTVSDSETTVQLTRTLQWTRTYRAFAYVELNFGMPKRIGGNPLVTAWELTPYSFVVDKFINIGSWLQSVSAHLTGGYKGIGASIKTEFTADSYRNTDWHDGPTLKVEGTHIQGCHNTLQSQVYERWPVSTGVPPFPGFNPNLSVPFVIDLVALFVKGRRDVHNILGRR